jgi:hypothetical protein
MSSNNPNLKQYAFKKGNQIGKLAKGILKRKTVIKNLIEKAIKENRKAGIKSIADFDELLFEKVIKGLSSNNVKISTPIALKMLEFRFPKKKEHDIGENTHKILVVHKPIGEFFKR